jgi:hypothetical protein
VGDDVADARIGVVAGEQVVDLGDDLFERHHLWITDGARPGVLSRVQRNAPCELAGGRALLMLGDLLEIHRGQIDLVAKCLFGFAKPATPGQSPSPTTRASQSRTNPKCALPQAG